MSGYVTREELSSLKSKIEDEVDLLVNNINSFNSEAGNLDSVLKKLKIYYNTSGGELSSNKIANTNFSSNKLSKAAKNAISVNISYYLSTLEGNNYDLIFKNIKS